MKLHDRPYFQVTKEISCFPLYISELNKLVEEMIDEIKSKNKGLNVKIEKSYLEEDSPYYDATTILSLNISYTRDNTQEELDAYKQVELDKKEKAKKAREIKKQQELAELRRLRKKYPRET